MTLDHWKITKEHLDILFVDLKRLLLKFRSQLYSNYNISSKINNVDVDCLKKT